MKQGFNYVAKVSKIAIFSFLKINLLAMVSTIILIVFGYYLLAKNIAVTGFFQTVKAIFSERPISGLLWAVTCLASPVLFFTLGNKYIVSKIMYKLVSDGSEDYINPMLDKMLLKFESKQPNAIKNVTDFSVTKLQLVQDAKTDKSINKWYRRAIVFALAKVDLNDVDFKQENFNVYNAIKEKTIQRLKEVSEPSSTFIKALFAFQWLLLLSFWIFKY